MQLEGMSKRNLSTVLQTFVIIVDGLSLYLLRVSALHGLA